MATIKDIPTRQLLSALNANRRYRDEDDSDTIILMKLGKGGVNDNVTTSPDGIRAELRTREHIPNKLQGKKLRQIMAKHRCSQEEAFTKFGDQFYPQTRIAVSSDVYKRICLYYSKKHAAQKYTVKS